MPRLQANDLRNLWGQSPQSHKLRETEINLERKIETMDYTDVTDY
jgi:hypothetical protein